MPQMAPERLATRKGRRGCVVRCEKGNVMGMRPCDICGHKRRFAHGVWQHCVHCDALLELRQDIEEALEDAAECVHDATQWWWAPEDQGPRTIDTLIGMLVIAAKKYRKATQ